MESSVGRVFQRLNGLSRLLRDVCQIPENRAIYSLSRASFATVPMLRNRRKAGGRQKQEALPARNDDIRGVKELRVVFPEGSETKIMKLQDAKDAARNLGLDLVMASTQAVPPVARIVAWEKMVYSIRQKQKAQERAAREHKKLSSPKEVRIGCHIAPHDLKVKLAAARKILSDHQQVLRLSVLFKGGREIEPAKKVLEDAVSSLQDVGKIKDPKHVQKPQINRWAVQLEPIKV
jgi:translation initiation factor IF-3